MSNITEINKLANNSLAGNIAVPTFTLVVLIVYHVLYIITYFWIPKYNSLACSVKARRNWIYGLIAEKNNIDVQIVQTLRNVQNTLVFFSAICSTGGFFFTNSLNAVLGKNPLLEVKLATICTCFFISFFFLASASKSIIDLQFYLIAKESDYAKKQIKKYLKNKGKKNYDKGDYKLLDVNAIQIEKEKAPETMVEVENVGKIDKLKLENCNRCEREVKLFTIYLYLGNRFLFLTIPVIFWFSIGVFGMLAACFVILGICIYFDHV